jgi:hypothetical protein
MRNRPLKKEAFTQLQSLMPEAKDTSEAVLKLIYELSRHYSNALQCYDMLEKYEKHPIIKILRKLKVIRI